MQFDQNSTQIHPQHVERGSRALYTEGESSRSAKNTYLTLRERITRVHSFPVFSVGSVDFVTYLSEVPSAYPSHKIIVQASETRVQISRYHLQHLLELHTLQQETRLV